MDHFQLRTYMDEVGNQVANASMATQDLVAALASHSWRVGPRAFSAVQALLAAATMLSKLLWPNPPARTYDGQPLNPDQLKQREWTVRRGQELRRALEIRDLPVLRSRTVRNGFEHFDERLDEYFLSGGTIVVDQNIMPRNAIRMEGGEVTHLRLLDNAAWTVSVLDAQVDLDALRSDIEMVARQLRAWRTAQAARRTPPSLD